MGDRPAQVHSRAECAIAGFSIARSVFCMYIVLHVKGELISINYLLSFAFSFYIDTSIPQLFSPFFNRLYECPRCL